MKLRKTIPLSAAIAGMAFAGTGAPVPEYWKGLHPCMTGPDWPCMACSGWLPGSCGSYDLDFDGDVDLRDFAILMVLVSEPERE